ncbi:ABC transporter permease [Parendozoicomonas haliclonae]|uniref:Macrolide export ATP-binding/permease protein MacB n=1 Tax=Parendozoicomonas haliclonae TaxID=1960125 RepID=A0A1X7APK2_9GAMM|nr:ABC transporter permease [Parendozoicomonas haliclonae]SMA50216.1 Macrolide export ATP-binding/permease protein MacB [Parendozoicomonas haliclonae]
MTLLNTALLSLRRNTMRSILTTLGIIIGISAVIIMFALGEGAQRQVEEQIESLGTNVLMVRAAALNTGGARQAAGTVSRLTLDDAQAIKDDIPEARYVGASINGQAQVVASNKNWSTTLTGANIDYLHASNWEIGQGRIFTNNEFNRASKVALIGETLAKELFDDPGFAVGEEIRVNKVPLTVIGVLAGKGQDMRGFDQDDTLITPLTIAQRRLIGNNSQNAKRVSRLTVSVDEEKNMDFVTEEIEFLLNQRHRVSAGDDSPFSVMNLSAMLSTRAEASAIFSLLLACVASVSLLVGGIGVMNIMLVSVTERTREIGLRMAVGAQPRHILVQFLFESVILCLIGAVLGVLLSLFAVIAIANSLDWDVVISPLIILISVVGTALIGVGFGFYPAWKAANLDPIEALRYE